MTLLPHLPRALIEAALNAAPGAEIASGKLDSPESSAALAVNVFGAFLESPADLPDLEGGGGFGHPALSVRIEAEMRFPWAGGRHPWLDAVVETDSHLIGVEAKRHEPFRAAKPAQLSDAYDRDVWGDDMAGWTALRDSLRRTPRRFARLDAAQLTKHALGLVTQARRRSRQAALVYLFAEPARRGDGSAVPPALIAAHRQEVAELAAGVAGDAVAFLPLPWGALLDRMAASPRLRVRDHAAAVRCAFPDI